MALTEKLRAIADAIRGKTGKTDSLTLEQMPEEISAIQSGDEKRFDVAVHEGVDLVAEIHINAPMLTATVTAVDYVES